MLRVTLVLLSSSIYEGSRLNGKTNHVSLRTVDAPSHVNETARVQNFLGRSRDIHLGIGDKVIEGTCGVTEKVLPTANQHAFCPEACPYRMEVQKPITTSEQKASTKNPDFCSFQCVDSCQKPSLNTMADVPDEGHFWCRHCRVEGCDECKMDGTDSCVKCKEGFTLNGNVCSSPAHYVWYGVYAFAGVIVLPILLWLLDIQFRPVTNSETLDGALKYRWSSRITPPLETNAITNTHNARMWPIRTNLHTTDVAGPGVMMLMNFELFVLAWGAIVLLGWVILSLAVDKDMLYYGTLSASTPRMYCILLLFGSEVKWSTLKAKVGFMAATYVGTTILCLAYSFYQVRFFREVDNEETTQSDFALLCNGLPMVKGGERVEDKWKEEMSRALGVQVDGVSVCWDHVEQAEALTAAMDGKIEMAEHKARDTKVTRSTSYKAALTVDGRPWRKVTVPLERTILGIEDPETEAIATPEEVSTILAELETTGNAFIIFATEKIRDEALERSKAGIQVGGNTVIFEPLEAEPDTVEWDTFAAHNKHGLAFNFCMAVLKICFALLIWTVFFYIPYAYFLLSASYEMGQEQNGSEALITCMFLVAGNLVMYQVCDVVSRGVGFRFSDQRQAAYVFFYFFAVMFNVLVDLGITYYLSFKLMAGRGVYTSNGTLLSTMPTFFERVTSYPLQRELGAQLKAYAFPATFLVGFIIEPIAVYYAPYWLNKRLIRIHDEMSGITAEKALECPELDMGRYADLILNMTLVCMVFFVPGGWTVILFGGLVFSHIYLYVYDSYRILRLSKRGDFASMTTETMVQSMLSIPCAILLQCLIFKADCMEGLPCSDGGSMIMRVAFATTLHILVHLGLVIYVIPKFAASTEEHIDSKETFIDSATKTPATWFSTNMVHCLRSEYVYKHNPPCSYFVPGREHLMQTNTKANSYFSLAALSKKKGSRNASVVTEGGGGGAGPKKRLDNNAVV